jgi:hypothetical protein
MENTRKECNRSEKNATDQKRMEQNGRKQNRIEEDGTKQNKIAWHITVHQNRAQAALQCRAEHG